MVESLLRKGAEAELFASEYLGEKALVKRRIAKDYRIPELDLKIRKERTKLEVGLLNAAKQQGVRTPFLYKIDRKNFEITMEFVDGERLKDALNGKNAGKYCKKLAKQIALLHNAGIVHGDLTTSNVLVKEKHSSLLDFCIIDFGLGFYSTKLEDKAVDLLNLKKTFQSTHFALFKHWKAFEKAYSAKAVDGRKVLKQIVQVEKRARYS